MGDLDSFIQINMNRFSYMSGENDFSRIVLKPNGESRGTLTISNFLLKLEQAGLITLIDEL